MQDSFFSFCEDEEDFLSISESTIEFLAGEGTYSLELTANISWMVSVADSWIGPSPSAGTGNAELILTVSANTTREDRRTLLTVATDAEVCEVEILQRDSYLNDLPVAGDLLTPYDDENEVTIPVFFSWEAGTDPNGEELCYTLCISTGGNSRTEVVSRTTDMSCYVPTEYLAEYSSYDWKVVTQNESGRKTESREFRFTTSTNTVYKDGEVVIYQQFTSESDAPVRLVVLEDGFVLEDDEYGGTMDQADQMAIEAFFRVEPYPTYRDHFTVYKVAAYSQERGANVRNDFYDLSQKKQTRNTFFESILDGEAVQG